jgi:hypothetical protein
LPASKRFTNNIHFPHWQTLYSHFVSILVAAGRTADPWVERGIAIGGMFSDFNQLLPYIPSPHFSIVIVFVTILHGLIPKVGIALMNVCILCIFQCESGIDIVCQVLSVFKIVLLLLIVIAGGFDIVIFLPLS